MYTILLIDDEPMMLKGMKYMLEHSDIPIRSILEATGGHEAIRLLQQFGADLIVTDIRMPDMTGLELCRMLSEQFPLVPCMIVSGHDEFAYAREGLRYGVKDFLLKPLNREQFTASLRQMLRKLAEIGHPNGISTSEWREIADAWTEAVVQDHQEKRVEAEVKWLECLRYAPPSLCMIWHGIFHVALLQRAGGKLERAMDIPLLPFQGQMLEELINWVVEDLNAICEAMKLHAYSDHQKLIYNAQLYIREHYNKEISLEELASSLGYSAPYFSQWFKQKTGISYVTYRTQLRMQRAQELLLKTDKPILQIAYEVGYNDVAGFIRTFKKETEQTPTEYRKGGSL
ncbi:response regulator transcription factor [Paenibacillus allorhizoplanae]|nr:response regulator [Paenibacillus allorhizoplanae]